MHSETQFGGGGGGERGGVGLVVSGTTKHCALTSAA